MKLMIFAVVILLGGFVLATSLMLPLASTASIEPDALDPTELRWFIHILPLCITPPSITDP